MATSVILGSSARTCCLATSLLLILQVLLLTTTTTYATEYTVTTANYATMRPIIQNEWITTGNNVSVLFSSSGTFMITASPFLSVTTPVVLPSGGLTKTFSVRSTTGFPVKIQLAGAVPFVSVSAGGAVQARADYFFSSLLFLTDDPSGTVMAIDNALANVEVQFTTVKEAAGGSPLAGNSILFDLTAARFICEACLFNDLSNNLRLEEDASLMRIIASEIDIFGMSLSHIESTASGSLVDLTGTTDIDYLYLTDNTLSVGSIFSVTGEVYYNNSYVAGNNVVAGSLIAVTQGIIDNTLILLNTAENTLRINEALVDGELKLRKTYLLSNFGTKGLHSFSTKTTVDLQSSSMSLNIPRDITCEPSAKVMFKDRNICAQEPCPENIFGFSNFDRCFSCDPLHVDECVGCDGKAFGPGVCKVDGMTNVFTNRKNDPRGNLQGKTGDGDVSGPIASARMISLEERDKDGALVRGYDLDNFAFNISRSNLVKNGVNVTRVELESALVGLDADTSLKITQDYPQSDVTYTIIDIKVLVEAEHLKFTFDLAKWFLNDTGNYIEFTYRIDAGSPIIRTETSTVINKSAFADYETEVVTLYTKETIIKTSVQRFAIVENFFLLALDPVVVEGETTRDYIFRIERTNLLDNSITVSYDPDLGVTLRANDDSDDTTDEETLTIVLAVVIPVAVLSVCLVVLIVLVVMVVLRYLVKPANIEDTVNL